MFEHIRIILVNPSHPGNIGAVARAMKNMGLNRLYLAAPESFPHPEAFYRAVGAKDVLDQCIVVDDLSQALQDCQLVFATSARSRHIEWPEYDPRQCAKQIMASPATQQIAIVFGRESSGLTNEELAQCHARVHIPAVAEFSSLNLAAAVQICAYELRMAYLEQNQKWRVGNLPPRELAANVHLAGLYEHLEATLIKLEFLNPEHPKKLMQRLRRLFSRAQLDLTEVNILRGILTAMDKML